MNAVNILAMFVWFKIEMFEMMKGLQNNEQQERWQHALRTAYFQKETMEIAPGQRWQWDVMRDVRRIGPLHAQVNPFQFVERFIWRFAAAACLFALILSVYAGVNGWNPVDEVATQFFSAPVEFTVAQAFGSYENYE